MIEHKQKSTPKWPERRAWLGLLAKSPASRDIARPCGPAYEHPTPNTTVIFFLARARDWPAVEWCAGGPRRPWGPRINLGAKCPSPAPLGETGLDGTGGATAYVQGAAKQGPCASDRQLIDALMQTDGGGQVRGGLLQTPLRQRRAKRGQNHPRGPRCCKRKVDFSLQWYEGKTDAGPMLFGGRAFYQRPIDAGPAPYSRPD